jgi:hypothetical protein
LLLILQELRTLLLKVQCSNARLADSTLQQPQQQQQQQQQCEALVQVTATCRLPLGLRLSSSSSSSASHALLVRPTSCQQLLVDQGPAAVAAAAASKQREHAASSVQTATLAPPAAAAAAAAAAGAVCLSTSLSSSLPGGMQDVYEMVVCPAEDDPLRLLKLQLLAATGLGLSHYFTLPDLASVAGAAATAEAPQDHQQQQQQQQGWQQQHLTYVLAAMAVALCDDEHLLQPAVVQQIVQQQRQQTLAAAGGVAVAAVSATAGMLLEDGGGSAAAAAGMRSVAAGATTAAAGAEATAAGDDGQDAWGDLKRRLLKRYKKACRKNLCQALEADAEAVQEALQGLQPLEHKSPSPAAAAAAAAAAAVASEHSTGSSRKAVQQGATSGCSCRILVGPGSSRTGVAIDHPAAVAAAGARVYLEGLARVLAVWIVQLQLQELSSSSGPLPGKKGGGRADKGTKKAKKQRQQ